MSKTSMIVNYAPGEECRVAVTEDGSLEEIQIEPADSVSFVGNIYKGKVMNVEAGIQAAFIDFGLETNGFLHISDLHPQYFPGEDEETTERVGKKTPRRDRPPIQQCLKRGQEIIVQVLKEGINTKGPTLTSYLSIPGRSLVMLPGMDKVGVSRKVEDEEERRTMRKVLDQLKLPESFGYILRTAGVGRSKTELQRDVAYLQRLWKDIETQTKRQKKPGLLYAESDLLMRSLRDVWTSEVAEIVIDNEAALQRASRFMKIVAPRSATKLLHYNRKEPIFHAYDIEEQIARIHSRDVPLPSGGSLVIDETEAMIAIDVNSGRMRNKSDAESTAYKTNCEAVDEICRQLRLRDIGGLVLCDLIDMVHRSKRKQIETRFRDKLKRDRAATRALPISQFGIVEMTRQRVRGSMRSTLYTPCPTCASRGILRKPAPVATWALREIDALLQHKRVGKVEVVVAPRVAGEFLSRRRHQLTAIERESNKKIEVRISDDIAADRVVFYAYDQNGADLDIEKLDKPKRPSNLKEWVYDPKKDQEYPLDALAGVPYFDTIEEADEAVEEDADSDEPTREPEQREQRREESGDEEHGGGRKRRRRRGGRRRRKGGSEEGEGGENRTEQRERSDEREEAAEPRQREPRREESRDEPREKREPQDREKSRGGGSPKRSGGRSGGRSVPFNVIVPRGDSWDLTPEELDEINKTRFVPLEFAKEPKAERDEDDTPRKSARADDEAAEPVESEASEEVVEESAASEEESSESAPTKKKSRRRSRSRKKPVTEGQEVEADEAPEPQVDSADDEDAPEATTKKKTSRKKRPTKKKSTTKKTAAKAGVSDDDDDDAKPVTKKKTTRKKTSKKTTSKKTTSKKTTSKKTTKKKAATTKKKSTTKAADSEVTPKPSAKVRPLYGTRRKVSDYKVAQSSGKRDD